VHLFQSTPCVQAGRFTQVFLNCTDDQEEENESGLFLLLVYSCTHTLQSGDAVRVILTVIMTSYDENVRSCKRHTVVCCAFCFLAIALPFLGLATHYRGS